MVGLFYLADQNLAGEHFLAPRFTSVILTFDDPSTRFPAKDHLEGFHPGSSSLYKRFLVPVHARESIVLAWLYTGYESFRRGMELIPTCIWSE
jgi:hypothetical protein